MLPKRQISDLKLTTVTITREFYEKTNLFLNFDRGDPLSLTLFNHITTTQALSAEKRSG